MNIILLVADSLRADHLSCYGYHKPTPNIDTLADNGTVYHNAWAMGSNTPASIPYILNELLLGTLRKLGYTPILIHSNVNVKLAKPPAIEIDLYKTGKWRRLAALAFTGVYCPWSRAEKMNQTALKLLEDTENLFLCIWYMDTHLPYLPPHRTGLGAYLLNKKMRKAAATRTYRDITKKDVAQLIDLYDGEISYLDRQIGTFTPRLNPETLIIFTSDHGEEFMEHGDLGHQNKEVPCLRHVPLIVKTPEREPMILDSPFSFAHFPELVLSKIWEAKP